MQNVRPFFHLVHFEHIGVYDFDSCTWRFYTGYALVDWGGNIAQSLMMLTSENPDDPSHVKTSTAALRRAMEAGWVITKGDSGMTTSGRNNA